MPAVLDVALVLLFNMVGDLSRTQTLNVGRQLRAGVRVLDLRLAVNPWLALHSRAVSTNQLNSSSLFSLDAARLEGSINLVAAGGALTADELPGALVLSHSLPAAPLADVLTDVQTFLVDNPGEVRGCVGSTHGTLWGVWRMNPLASAGKLACLVSWTSCPPCLPPLPPAGQVMVLQVVADTIDVNVAGSVRMTPEAWAAAADMFRDKLSGVQLLTAAQVGAGAVWQRTQVAASTSPRACPSLQHLLTQLFWWWPARCTLQVQNQTLGQLAAAAAPGGGSVLLLSRELHSHGLPAVSDGEVEIQSSWANGTNSDDVATLMQRLEQWLRDWEAAAWQQSRQPMLLASAEVTLGARTVLAMVRNRLWRLHHEGRLGQGPAAADALVAQLLQADDSQGDAAQSTQQQQVDAMRSSWWQSLLGRLASNAHQQQHAATQQRQAQLAALSVGATTLYQLGVETNARMLADVLRNNEVRFAGFCDSAMNQKAVSPVWGPKLEAGSSCAVALQVPKSFNLWSMDAVTPAIVNWIIALNGPVQPLKDRACVSCRVACQ
jgi:hypothetical protein